MRVGEQLGMYCSNPTGEMMMMTTCSRKVAGAMKRSGWILGRTRKGNELGVLGIYEAYGESVKDEVGHCDQHLRDYWNCHLLCWKGMWVEQV